MTDAVVLVPGLMGSELWKGDTLIWPGAPWEMLTPYSKLAELLEPDLEVGDVIRSAVKPVYAPLMDALARCGFSEGGDKPTLMLCPYDWRKDNAESARRLAGCVQRLFERHGEDVKVDVLAHSMGGLVARYFLESGEFSNKNCAGFGCVRSLVTMGTPHRGAPMALAGALGAMKKLFLNAEQVRALVSRPAFPSVYQLLPPEDEPFVWDLSAKARLGPVSVYRPEMARRLGLSEENLGSAVRFRAGLSEHDRAPNVAYFCFVGASFGTKGHARVDSSAEKMALQFVTVAAGGDDTVPHWSASLPGAQKLAVSGSHGSIFQEPDLLNVLGQLLGKPGYLAGEDESKFAVSVSPEVAEAGSWLEVALRRFRPVDAVDAELVLFKVADSDGKVVPERPAIVRHRIHYAGARLEALSVVIPAPMHAGAYAVDLQAGGASLAIRACEVLVQRTA